MIRNSKPAIRSANPKPASKNNKNKSSAALTKQALAVTEANLARIESAERGEAPPSENIKPGKSKKEKGAKTAKAQAPKKAKVRKTSLLDHAAAILAASKDPLNAKQIIEKVRTTTDWKSEGKTPHATLYAAMIREIADKGKDARFKKVERGLFAAAVGKAG